MFRRQSVVPYGRMQFVDVTAGPVERFFKLSTVKLHTAAAASDARIPGLEQAEAARLRDRLAAARGSKGGRPLSLAPPVGGWQKSHPLTPIVAGGRIGVVLLLILAEDSAGAAT